MGSDSSLLGQVNFHRSALIGEKYPHYTKIPSVATASWRLVKWS